MNEIPPTVRAAGDPRKQGGWTLLPADTSNGECSQCGRVHDPDQPHDAQQLRYQYSFYAEHDRWPTWTDAMAHCSQPVQEFWSERLRERGVDL